MLMYFQATIDYEHFARALSIGPETMVMNFRPTSRCTTGTPSRTVPRRDGGTQTVAISRIVNAFFGWEFNSCEMLVQGDEVYPIDYANACPDVAVTSLHYYFPWAITALLRWSVFSWRPAGRPRRPAHPQVLRDRRRRVVVVRREGHRLPRPRRRALRHRPLLAVVLREPPDLDEQVHDWVTSTDFERLLRETVDVTYPARSSDGFMAHFKGLTDLWAVDKKLGG